MKKIITLLSLVFFSFVSIKAQRPNPYPNATPEPAVNRTAEQAIKQTPVPPGWNSIPINRRDNNNENNTRLIREEFPTGPVYRRVGINAEELYRKSTKEELAAVSPEPADFNKFAEFLRQPKTGLLRLIDGKGCSDEKLVVSTANCWNYTIPGTGASYSFREVDYRYFRLSDLTFTDNNFKCLGDYTQGILTNLGNVPLETITLQTPGVDFLSAFKPENNHEKNKESREQFNKGVLKDGFTYKSEWQAIENTTYILRSIAYKRGIFMSKESRYIPEDKRKDILIAFRVVRKNADGSIIILWKELARKDGPRLG